MKGQAGGTTSACGGSGSGAGMGQDEGGSGWVMGSRVGGTSEVN